MTEKRDEEPTCDTCIYGKGTFVHNQETDDFYCDDRRVPFDQRIKVTPETPACKIYLGRQIGFRQRIKARNETEDPESVVHFGGMTFGTDDLTDRQIRDDNKEDGEHDKGITRLKVAR